MPGPTNEQSLEQAAVDAATAANEQEPGVSAEESAAAVEGQSAEIAAASAEAQAKAAAKEKARKEGKLEGVDFEEVWAAHPHNYLEDESQNTSSQDLNAAQGWKPDQWANTCAIRMSVMLNTLGGAYKITKAKAKAAGIKSGRVFYSRKTKWYYLLSAREIWQYSTSRFGKPDMTWPPAGRFKSEEDFNASFAKDIEPIVNGKRGLVAFDKIFGYSGSGHVDVFNGSILSDGSWYASKRVMVWYM